MSIFTAIPEPLRKAARAVLPARFVDGSRYYILRHYYVRGFVNELAKYLRLDPAQVQRTYLRRMREKNLS